MNAELTNLLMVWEVEFGRSKKLIAALPHDKYDFRPDAGGRSLGELAWHLAEGDAYMSQVAQRGEFQMGGPKPPNLDRPRTIPEIHEKIDIVHADAVERVKNLSSEQLAKTITFPGGPTVTMMQFLEDALIRHTTHHRGQLSLMCRLAGGTAPGMYGPSREEMAAMRAQMEKK